MKILTDFVTNSSSSSFVVFFPRKPESSEEVKELMFGSRQEITSPYNDDYYWTTKEIAEIVFRDLGVELEEGSYGQTFRKSVLEDVMGYDDFKKYSSENPDAFICVFEYSDDDPLGTTMEYGNIFRKLPHIRISMH